MGKNVMNRTRKTSICLTLMACVLMVTPRAALADVAGGPRSAKSVLDIALLDGGLLVGQVVNQQGIPQSSAPVRLIHRGKQLLETTTDVQGRFSIEGLKGGSYSLATGRGQIPIRAWSASTAPPDSSEGVLLVQGSTVRGQSDLAPAEASTDAIGSHAVGSHAIPTYSPPTYSPYMEAGAGGPMTAYNASGTPYMDGSSEYYDGNPYHEGHAGAAGGGAASGGGLLGFGITGEGGVIRRVLASPLLVGAGVAAAIAIPIALDDDDAS